MSREEASAEESLLRRLEHECAAFRGCRGGASFFPSPADGNEGDDEESGIEPTWRLRERMRTVSVALVLCLNIGTDPPDRIQSDQRACKECWIDPKTIVGKRRALEEIGKALQKQYERWHGRPRYRLLLDPTDEDLSKMCANLRRTAKRDRVLIHFNGHGVPRPTREGEIWVFNKHYTQYIPVRISQIRQVTQGPAVYVLDCSGAAVLFPFLSAPLSPRPGAWREEGGDDEEGSPRRPLRGGPQRHNAATDSPRPPPTTPPATKAAANNNSQQQQQQRRTSWNGDRNEDHNAFSHHHHQQQQQPIASPVERNPLRDECIVLAPCGADESLPTDPRLPADLFTACLTTPIAVALRWFVQKHPNSTGGCIPLDDVEKAVPGNVSDRKSPKGELNWIFTAVTDSIAWNVLPAPLFQRLFRQDLLVASLFRNFLLAERVFKAHNCTPQTLPRLPSTAQHPLWDAWDLAVEQCLAQLAIGAKLPATMPTNATTPQQHQTSPLPQQHAASQQQQQQSDSRHHQIRAATPDVATQYTRAETPFRVTPPLESRVEAKHVAAPFQDQDASFMYGREFRGLCRLATLPPLNPHLLEMSRFFEEQLTAFEVWLRFGGARDALDSPPPQLPVVLQVLLSQAHRVHALVLLRRFLELGPRAVNLALCVGFFPYVLKLLETPQTPPPDLLRPLVAIWAAILAFDDSCKDDLAKTDDHIHFVRHACSLARTRKKIAERRRRIRMQLSPNNSSENDEHPSPNDFDSIEDQSLLSAFVLAAVMRGGESSRKAKMTCLREKLDKALLDLLMLRHEQYPGEKRRARLRRWLCLCAANLCHRCCEAKVAARERAPPPSKTTTATTNLLNEAIDVMSTDSDPSARAAAVRAVATMIYDDDDYRRPDSQLVERDRDAAIMARVASTAGRDASGFVRHEAVLAVLSFATVSHHRDGLRSVRRRRPSSSALVSIEEDKEEEGSGHSAHYSKIWAVVSNLATDPFEPVANVARDVVGALSTDSERAVEHRIVALARTRSGVESWARKRFAHEVRSLSIAHGLETRKMLLSRRGSRNQYRSDDEDDEEELFHAAVDAEQAEDSAGVDAYLARDPLSRAGELRLYRRHRNRFTMREARALADGVRLALEEDERRNNSGDGDELFRIHQQMDGTSAPSPHNTNLSPLEFLPQAPAITNDGAELTRHLRFHPHEPFLLAVDERDGLLLWDYEAREAAARWRNSPLVAGSKADAVAPGHLSPASPSWLTRPLSSSRSDDSERGSRGARITSVEWLDASQESILACGSDDGVVRIWNNFNLEERIDPEERAAASAIEVVGLDASLYGNAAAAPATTKATNVHPRLLSAFVAADDLTEKTKAGLVCCWKQGEGLLYCGGDSKYIRAFDARAEMLAASVHVPFEEGREAPSATCLCTHPNSPKLLFAGFSDGAVRMFDIRESLSSSSSHSNNNASTNVARGSELPRNKLASYIVNVSCHAASSFSSRELLVAACIDGTVMFWDVRHSRGAVRTVRVQNSPMRAFAAHSCAPLLASGSDNQFVKFMTRDAEQLNIVRFHEERQFMDIQKRISAVTSLAFHDSKLLCAFGGSDSKIGLCTMQRDHASSGEHQRRRKQQQQQQRDHPRGGGGGFKPPKKQILVDH